MEVAVRKRRTAVIGNPVEILKDLSPELFPQL